MARKRNQFTVAMVTDVGGVDDKSFNQSAWEGLQALVKIMAWKKAKTDMTTSISI